MQGQAEIASELARVFADHQTAAYVAKVREVRPLGLDAVILHAVAGMVPRGQSAINPATNAVQTVVVAPTGGELRIALLQNTPAAFHGRPALAEQLTKELTEVLRSGAVVVRGASHDRLPTPG
jgi:hypothetical protein